MRESECPKLNQIYLGSSCKSSTSHFESNEVQLRCKGHMRFLFTYLTSYIQPLSLISELRFSYCSHRVTGALGQVWDTGSKYHKSPSGIHRK